MAEKVVLRFDNVTFEYLYKKPILHEANFSVRKGAKITLMGQNGAGKSTLLKLIKNELKSSSGKISITNGATIGVASQAVAREDFDLSIEEYFTKTFKIVPANIKSQINKVMEAVNLDISIDKKVGDLSGGQQARLLLAYALIQNPDILLLDEPTNNLDSAGIDHLIQFLIMYDKTVIVISHDADFLNCFTEGVIYLNVFTHQVETYVGDYNSVVEEIKNRVERERMKNARLEKIIKDRKEKVNFFSHKGGKMRKLAKKMRNETEEMEENKVDVRREDKTIRKFTIPAQNIIGEIVKITSIKIIQNHEPVIKKINEVLRKTSRLLVSGPNGIGKSTLLRSLVSPKHEGAEILDGVRVGYYSQDFTTLDYDEKVFDSLQNAIPASSDAVDLQEMRSIAAGFLITGELMGHRVGDLSVGQKGLLLFARLVLMCPGLLILDEPTNHINFRHISIIAEAINGYKGPILMVSHMPEFVSKIKFNDYLDLEKI